MILELLIEEVDFTDCLVTRGSRSMKADERDWSVRQVCFGEDTFEFTLDFGHHGAAIQPPPEIFKQAEVIFQEHGTPTYNEDTGKWTPTGEGPYYTHNQWYINESNRQSSVFAGASDGQLNVGDLRLENRRRPRRLFSGVISEIEQEDQGVRPYPLYRIYCKGWGWRMNNITLFGPPQTSMWHRQSDVQIILHTNTSPVWEEFKETVLNGESNYDEYGFAPALVDWFQHREIIRPGNKIPFKDTSPGNLIELGYHTKAGLFVGWNAVGSPLAASRALPTPEYLSGVEILEVFPVGETPGKILSGLASWSGCAWWMSPYKEINYTRPQDWEPRELGALFNTKRSVNVEQLATAIVMMNANIQTVNENWHLEPLPVGTTQVVLENNAQPLFNNVGLDETLYVERLQVYQGSIFATRVDFKFGFPPADEFVEIPNPSGGGTSRSPVYHAPPARAPAQPVSPPAEMYYDNQLNKLRVKTDDYFKVGEFLRFAPFTLMVPQQNWNVFELFHDPTLGDSAGMYIQPLYMDNAHTIWDTLRRVAERLEKGSDIDAVSFYSFTGAYKNEDDEWYDLRGKSVDFESEFLKIDGKQPFSRRKATQAEMQRLRNDIGKGNDPTQVIEYLILDAPYIVQMEEAYRTETPASPTDPPQTVIWGDHTVTISPFAEDFPEVLRGSISLAEFRTIIDAVWGYLAEKGEEWKSRSDKDAGIFYVPREHNLITRQLEGLDNAETVQRNIDQIMQIYFSLHLEQTFHSRFFLSQFVNSEDVRGYYCRELEITPLGPSRQRYKATCWRTPPQPQEAMRGSAVWMARGNNEMLEKLKDAAIPPEGGTIILPDDNLRFQSGAFEFWDQQDPRPTTRHFDYNDLRRALGFYGDGVTHLVDHTSIQLPQNISVHRGSEFIWRFRLNRIVGNVNSQVWHIYPLTPTPDFVDGDDYTFTGTP